MVNASNILRMPLYQYTAKDGRDAIVEGKISASDPKEAAKNLELRGLNVLMVDGWLWDAYHSDFPVTSPPLNLKAKNMQAVPSGPVNIVNARTGVATTFNPAAAASQSIPVNPDPVATSANPYASGKQSDKTLIFIFSQFAAYLNSGQNPVTMLENLGNNQPNPAYKETLLVGAKAVATGVALSEALGRFPYLYPPNVIGTLRAGELGGFLPQACQNISDHYTESIKFNRWGWWLYWIVVSNAVGLLPTWAILRAMAPYMKALDATGGQGNGFSLLTSAVAQSLKGQAGILLLISIVGFYLLHVFWFSLINRTRRHAAILRVPILKDRARTESMAQFSWVLGSISRAGISPRTAFVSAAESVPNLRIRQDLINIGQGMKENTRLSEAFAQTSAVSHDMISMIQTGEITGNVAPMLQQISDAQVYATQANTTKSRGQIGCWIALAFFVAAAGGEIFYGQYMSSMITYFTQ